MYIYLSKIVISYHCYLYFVIFVLVIFCYVTNELKTVGIYYLLSLNQEFISGLGKWLSGQEYLLFFERTRVWFQNPHDGSRGIQPLLVSADTHGMHTWHIHVNKIIKISVEGRI